MSFISAPRGPDLRLSVFTEMFRKQERDLHGDEAESQFHPFRASRVPDVCEALIKRPSGGWKAGCADWLTPSVCVKAGFIS